MLIREHLEPGGLTLEGVSSSTGISVDRLARLEEGAVPSPVEMAALADALNVDPIHLFRRRPLVVAQRSTEGSMSSDYVGLVDALDLHIATYVEEEPAQEFTAFSTNRLAGARRAGEGWATGADIRTFTIDAPDPMVTYIEETMKIPVLFWPVPDAPFGATVRLDGWFAIWVNSSGVQGSQQRFTLAHEVGHLILDHNTDSHVEPSRTVDESVDSGPPQKRRLEQQAQAFASGALASRETIEQRWSGETTPAAVAVLAARLGASYTATVNVMNHHRFIEGEEAADLKAARVWHAYAEAGRSEIYRWFADQADRRRVPSMLMEGDRLERSLARALADSSSQW